MKRDEKGARSTHENDEKCAEFWWENLKCRDILEDLGVDEGVILK